MEGVYKIVNDASGDCYVGSSVNIKKRWYAHKYALHRGNHPNRFLQRAWNKYGANAFSFSVIEHCYAGGLIEAEQRWIDEIKPRYNLAPVAGSCLGVKHSEEFRANVSKRNMGNKYCLGRVLSDETRAAIGAANKGKTKGISRPRELVEKTAQAHRGMKRSEDTKRKISEGKKGKKLRPRTEAHRANISKALKGKPKTENQMLRLQQGRKAYVCTDEHRRKMAEIVRKGYEDGTRIREKTTKHKDKIGMAFAKLSDDQVRQILAKRLAGQSGVSVAAEYNTTTSTVSAIMSAKRYKWVTRDECDNRV